MSEFGDLWSEVAAPSLMREFADNVLCTPVGSTERTVAAVVWPEEIVEEQTPTGIKRKHIRWLTVPRTEAVAGSTAFLAGPGIRDAWTVDGVSYVVEAIESQTEVETLLKLVRVATHEETREALRRRN